MWRWSRLSKSQKWLPDVFSTYVEVILYGYLPTWSLRSFLHVCGGDPTWSQFVLVSVWFSPRMWRWSSHQMIWLRAVQVFSTYVEVILNFLEKRLKRLGFLHVCGGDPEYLNANKRESKFSPRMWRWSSSLTKTKSGQGVFSTYVEVILTMNIHSIMFLRFLHVCGGDPQFGFILNWLKMFSPRMWRWSQWVTFYKQKMGVFSTYVEVILINSIFFCAVGSFLHVCGGDPHGRV